MNNLLMEVLQWLQNNGYHRASFDRIIGIVPTAATYEQLNELIQLHSDIFRSAVIKGGLPGLAVHDDVDIGILLASLREESEMVLSTAAVEAPVVPHVTPDEIESEIRREAYRNLGGAVKAAEGSSMYNVTICSIELRNGFVVIGKSACVYPELYNEEKGRELARADAIRQLWPFLGFRLADRRAAL
jgi:hypothetical protein